MKVLRPKELASALGASASSLRRWCIEGRLPEPIKIGKGAVGWPEEQIESWLQQKSNEAKHNQTATKVLKDLQEQQSLSHFQPALIDAKEVTHE